MPKKRAPSYAQTKPTYVHPSLQRAASPNSPPAAPQTVNERIQQLRREQAPRTAAGRRDEVTEVVTQRTIPPHLRRILQMAEVDSPRPKPGTRSTAPRAGARPPPGPAAPVSWLHRSRHAPHSVRSSTRSGTGVGDGVPARFCALARLHNAEFNRLPPVGSLVHQCLRTLATQWEDLVEYEQHYLPALPIPLKEALLSYLSVYGPNGCLSLSSVKILFGNENEVQGGSGSEEIRFLDLTGLLNPTYTLSDLNKSLVRSAPSAALAGAVAELSLGSPKGKEKVPVALAESWEDEVDEPNTITLSSTLSVPIFPNLTRLSLARPGNCASWTELLTLSTKLNTLTHLSLAYWPRPSTTPNAATASMVSKHAAPVALGGSHYYSDLDDDWEEAANILRRLSLNTYCLKWLDLEGCSWYRALTWGSNKPPGARSNEDWVQPSTCPSPDWSGAWRQIEYLNLFQGWIPNDPASLRSMPASVVPAQLLSWLREHSQDEEYRGKLRPDSYADVEEWVEREKVARTVGSEIYTARKIAAGKYCTIDHGWERANVLLRRKPVVDADSDGE